MTGVSDIFFFVSLYVHPPKDSHMQYQRTYTYSRMLSYSSKDSRRASVLCHVVTLKFAQSCSLCCGHGQGLDARLEAAKKRLAEPGPKSFSVGSA